jgi:hypothetical protein
VRRILSIIAAEAVTLVVCHSALAASDITMAAIATGRLYVLGTTERPHTPVMLDEQFRTESDDKGKFQYELIYHPARCIVSAVIGGKTFEAVVSNCGEQCRTSPGGKMPPPGAAALAPAAKPALANASKPSASPSFAQPSKPTKPSGPAASSHSAAPGPGISAPPPHSAANRGTRRSGSHPESASPVINPPPPLSRSASRGTTRARSARPIKTPQRSKPDPQQDPSDRGDLLQE